MDQFSDKLDRVYKIDHCIYDSNVILMKYLTAVNNNTECTLPPKVASPVPMPVEIKTPVVEEIDVKPIRWKWKKGTKAKIPKKFHLKLKVQKLEAILFYLQLHHSGRYLR